MPLTEAQWQAQVVGLARFYSWVVYHPPTNRPNARGRVQRVTAGFPDLTLARETRLGDGEVELIFAELKTDTGRLGPGQRDWLDLLGRVPGAEAVLWRPRDFEEVQTRLARGKRISRPAFAPA